MIKIKLFIRNLGEENLTLKGWKAELSTTIKGKPYKKEVEGLIEDSNNSEPAKVIMSMLKTDKGIKVISNSKTLLTEFPDSLEKIEDKSLKLSLSKELLEEASKKDIPAYLNIRIGDIKAEGFLKELGISMYFMKAYLFFSKYPEKIFDIPLLEDCKKEGLVENETTLEDIFSNIESYMV